MRPVPFCKFEYLGPYRQRYFAGGGIQGKFKELKRVLVSFPKEGGTLIDFGCGDGAICVRLAEYRKMEVYGIDTNRQGLIYAQEWAIKRGVEDKVKFEERSIYCLDEIGKFDYGLCTEVIEVVDDPVKALNIMLSKVKNWVLITFIEVIKKNEFTWNIWRNQEDVEAFLTSCNIKFKFHFAVPSKGTSRVLYYKIFPEEK
jgi:2-polyprenyl-3-methyl-5-hydroxy-6-metoxy-1,4-benzoquinol methylase